MASRLVLTAPPVVASSGSVQRYENAAPSSTPLRDCQVTPNDDVTSLSMSEAAGDNEPSVPTRKPAGAVTAESNRYSPKVSAVNRKAPRAGKAMPPPQRR